ncbi:hypothetical protein BC833DRAFT_589485 [Globomyces pollinis-pini]|nr:hypothetical protein BC833DRAFT_589485 [Globomyces pollinis-pini]
MEMNKQTNHSIDSLIAFIEELKEDSLDELIKELKERPKKLPVYFKRTEAQWVQLYGPAAIYVYNELNNTEHLKGNSSESLLIIKEEMFQIHYPSGMNSDVIQTIQTLSELLKLPEFTSTFQLEANHEEILTTIKEKELIIRFKSPKVYNSTLLGYPKDCYVEDEYGWFDARVSGHCVNINYDCYTVTSNNIPFLKMLALVTTIHELQHFLRKHLDEKLSTPPISSARPPQFESGDSWEINNLGGKIGILSHRETKDVVSSLYLTSICNGKEVQSLMGDAKWIEELLLVVSKGQNVFPLKALDMIDPIPGGLLKGKVSHKCRENSASEVALGFDDFIYVHKRPNDKLGRMDS